MYELNLYRNGKAFEKSLWVEAVANAVYTLNQCLIKTLYSVILNKLEVRGSLALHTCVFLEALVM